MLCDDIARAPGHSPAPVLCVPGTSSSIVAPLDPLECSFSGCDAVLLLCNGGLGQLRARWEESLKKWVEEFRREEERGLQRVFAVMAACEAEELMEFGRSLIVADGEADGSLSCGGIGSHRVETFQPGNVPSSRNVEDSSTKCFYSMGRRMSIVVYVF